MTQTQKKEKNTINFIPVICGPTASGKTALAIELAKIAPKSQGRGKFRKIKSIEPQVPINSAKSICKRELVLNLIIG